MTEKKTEGKTKEKTREEEGKERRKSEEEEKERRKAQKAEKKERKEEGGAEGLAFRDLGKLELQKPDISEKESKLADEVPSLKSVERKIPDLSLEEKKVQKRKVKIGSEIPEPEEEKTEEIPIVRTSSLNIRSKIREFDKTKPQIEGQPKRKIKVPVYRKKKSPKIRAQFNSFTSNINSKVNEKLKTLEKVEEEGEKEEMTIEEEEKAISVEANLASESGGGGEEVPEFLDFIFKVKGSGGKLQAKGTKIVLFKDKDKKEDSFIGSFITLCRRIYREKHGGEPDFQSINKIDEINKREIEKWLDADKKVILIDLDSGEERIDQGKLREKLEATIGEFGYIIFKTDDKDFLDEYEGKLWQIYRESPHSPLHMLKVEPQEIGFSQKKRLTELAWGNLDLEEVESGGFKVEYEDLERAIGTGVFDDLFNKIAQKLFNRMLEKVKREEGGKFKRATKENRGQISGKERDDYEEGESPLHYNIKVFLVRYLVNLVRRSEGDLRRLDQIKNRVKTEDEEIFGGEVIPDVRVNGEIYEVETLFAGGEEPTNKIVRKIEKYEGRKDEIDKVHIVLDNLTFLRHIKELVQIRKQFSYLKNNSGKNLLKFHTLNLRRKGLFSLDEIIKNLRELKNRQI